MSTRRRLFLILILTTYLGTGCRSSEIRRPAADTEIPISTTTVQGVPVQPAMPTSSIPEIPYEMVSGESLFAYLEDLTSIQPYSGWRNSASSGEAEALDYVEAELHEFATLQHMSMELERQSFPVYMSTEIRDSRLTLIVDGQEVEVPADGLRGSRNLRPAAAYFDSDGVLGDTSPNPRTANGPHLSYWRMKSSIRWQGTTSKVGFSLWIIL